MDEQSEQKFMELSPVMELIFSQITNMVKYLDLYASDIEATNLEQYQAAKKGLSQAIAAFEEIYGVSASASAETELEDEEVFEDTPVKAEVSAPDSSFASGDDEASLAKAKQAVEELKTLFSDMQKSEVAGTEAIKPQEVAVPVEEAPVAGPQFVSQQQQQVQAPAMPTPMAPVEQAPVAQAPVTPAPVTPQQDAGEIDSILAELRKLQNKGAQQL